MGKPLKLMYLAGTQDPETALSNLRRAEDDPNALFVPYVRQFLNMCEDIDAQGIVVSSRPPRRRLRLDQFSLYYIPNPLRSAHGRRYALGQILYGLIVTALCLLHRPHVVFVGDGMMHYRTIPLLRVSGARIVLSFHNTLWTCHSPKPDRWKGIARKNLEVFSRTVSAIICASDTIAENFAEISAGRCKPLITFLPTFRRDAFDKVDRTPARGVFTVLFVGRIVPDKGIFDVLRIVAILRKRGMTDLRVVMCGEGPADRALAAAIEDRGLSDVVDYVGQLDADTMLEHYAAANVVIVPTRTSFREGFNHVVAEALLCHRRVITSYVCPAAHYFDTGIYLASPDSPESYADGIWSEYLRREEDHSQLAEVGQVARLFSPSFGWYGAAMEALKIATREDPRISFESTQ